MTTFAVSEEKQKLLKERMQEVGLKEEDIEESFVRSSGKGGQHVNKTSTCVKLKHKPTGLAVTCMRERSQSINRFIARRELAEKLAESMGLVSVKATKADKIKRQKARKKRRTAKKLETASNE
ncbi:MAG: peptide chain release factor-like protein [Desulfuromonadales bacterium]|nr:peptide chain release factor-like protein [Desulfuromonadales bacterium]